MTCVLFLPDACPGCSAPVTAVYSQYRHARRHPLFAPLLAGLAVSGLGLILLSLWAACDVVWDATAQLNLLTKERGMLVLLAFFATLPGVFLLMRWGWRRIHRLPRAFDYECANCRQRGVVRIVDSSEPIPVGGGVPLVGAIDALDGLPAVDDAVAARGERLAARQEKKRRAVREWEQQQPPNPDFNFR